MSRPHLQYITMVEFAMKQRGRISKLAFSPKQENCLAYATGEGQVCSEPPRSSACRNRSDLQVGLIDTTNPKQQTLLPKVFDGEVHRIEWVDRGGDQIELLAATDGHLVIYNSKKPLDSKYLTLNLHV